MGTTLGLLYDTMMGPMDQDILVYKAIMIGTVYV